MRDVIDATVVFVKALNLNEASMEIIERVGTGTKYRFRLGDQFVNADMHFEYIKIEYNTDTIFEVDYLKAKDLFALRIFRAILVYCSNEHA